MINEEVEELTLDDQKKNISNAMNKFFINIGKKMAPSIRHVNFSAPFLSSAANVENSFLHPTTPAEVETVINGHKNNNAIRHTDVDTKFNKAQ